MPNPFENQETSPATRDRAELAAKLAKALPSYGDLEKQKAFLADKISNEPIFRDIESNQDLAQAIKDYEGDNLASFVAERAGKIWEREGKYTDPYKYSLDLFKADREREGYTMVNEFFYYGVDKNRAHIHLRNPYAAAGMDSPGANVMSLRGFLKGLVQFAQDIRERRDAKRITATSPLLTNPQMTALMQSVGFKDMGPVSDEIRNNHFKGDTRDIHLMVADKGEFCEKVKDFKELQARLLAALKEKNNQ